MQSKLNPNLTGVPETMLWTLHNRASEMLRSDAVLRDEKALEIYHSLDYDYERSFGVPDGSHAMRSLLFDERLREFLQDHPRGVIVNLGEGLETQRYRLELEGNEALWISVDVPEAMAIRERFIVPDEVHRHVPVSALDPSWMDEVPPERPVFITAQGLFMYFKPSDVEWLFKAMATRFAGGWLMFDHISQYFSKKTLKGWNRTGYYTAPPMPWGVSRAEVENVLRGWSSAIESVRLVDFRMPRGLWRYLGPVVLGVPGLKNIAPGISLVRFSSSRCA